VLSKELSPSAVGWFAIATGITGLLGLAFIMLFFAIGQPFGTLNDICNGLGAVLSVVLVWVLYSKLHPQLPLLSQVTITITVLGAILAVMFSMRERAAELGGTFAIQSLPSGTRVTAHLPCEVFSDEL